MTRLTTAAEVKLEHMPAYLDQIEDRLQSFEGRAARSGSRVEFAFPFGEASFDMQPGRLVMQAHAPDPEALARLKDLLATAVQVYARAEAPTIRWKGDLAGETRLPQFREMTVSSVTQLTPLMRRIRLEGNDLGRFAKFGGMHIRMLFPTDRVPNPDWPAMGENGLVVWPPEDRKPTPRAYTVRRLDVAEGWMDVDILAHKGESVGARWAASAAPGQKVGVMGPVGRPVPMNAQWYVMGADETGLPAVSRMLETLAPETRGIACIEVADEAERHEIANRTQIEVKWIYRNDVPAGHDDRLANAVMAVKWPDDLHCFGWFAAEGGAASTVRNHWRVERGLGRDLTLTATYWNLGQTGFMAG